MTLREAHKLVIDQRNNIIGEGGDLIPEEIINFVRMQLGQNPMVGMEIADQVQSSMLYANEMIDYLSRRLEDEESRP